MNTLILLVGLRPWSALSWQSLLTRVFVAISVFSVEVQIATWLGVGSIYTLPIVNAILAVVSSVAWRHPGRGAQSSRVRLFQAVPLAAALSLAGLVLLLNLALPLTAADQYHLEKIEKIEATGTLQYDVNVELKFNVLPSLYELLLADFEQIPLVGPTIVRLHGFLGLLLYLIAVGTVRDLLSTSMVQDANGGSGTIHKSPEWVWAAMVTVPVLFHQLVLVKNDLFAAVPGLVALTWVVTRAQRASWREIVWASWMAGLAVAIKFTAILLLIMMGITVLITRRRESWRPAASLALGSFLGMLSGGLIFAFVENMLVYGNMMPVGEMGARNSGISESLAMIARFGLSLFDLGLLTRTWWPARGGWGGTFGLPFIWAVVVLLTYVRKIPEARRALCFAVIIFLVFSGTFPEADLAQRIVLAPGLMLIAMAAQIVMQGNGVRARFRAALVVVLLLSTIQIGRSAVLYLQQL